MRHDTRALTSHSREVREIAAARSMRRGHRTRRQHYPQVTLELWERPSLGGVATAGAMAAGAGAAVQK